MNVTFFIGNGFDIALGMQTSYSDFLKWYLEQDSDDIEIKIFKDDIEKDSNSNQSKNLWSDVEEGLAAITEKYQNVETYMKCYEDLHEKLVEYLTMEEKKYQGHNDYLEKISTVIGKQLSVYYNDLRPTEASYIENMEKIDPTPIENLNFICFNYTTLLDNVCEIISKNAIKNWDGSNNKKHKMIIGKLCHIHGYLDRYPILGVCRDEMVLNNNFLSNGVFRSTFIKSESDIIIGERWRPQAKALIDRSDIICIFGMSLGKTDSDYWEMVSSWLLQDSKRRVIIYWHENEKTNTISVYKMASITSKIKNMILDYSPLSIQEKKILYDKIFVKTNTDKLFFVPENMKISSISKNEMMKLLFAK